MAGQLLISRKMNVQNGENILVIKDLQSLKPGVLVMEIVTDEERIVQKMIKN
jgi:hypothetical protein